MSRKQSFPSFEQLIKLMDRGHRSTVEKILHDYPTEFYTAPGGLHKHQNWRGGYADHIHEVMSLASILYRKMSEYRPLPFSLSSALFVLFFHDLEKMFRYTADKRGRLVKTPLASQASHRKALLIMRRLKISINPEERNALRYIHGENEDYHPTRRVMNELAAFVHCCDTLSARVWHDYPHIERNAKR